MLLACPILICIASALQCKLQADKVPAPGHVSLAVQQSYKTVMTLDHHVVSLKRKGYSFYMPSMACHVRL